MTYKDLNIEIKLRNNQLVARREALGLSAPKIAEKMGISYHAYLRYENLQQIPFTVHGYITEIAQKILNYYNEDVESLWPEVIRQIKNTKLIKAIDVNEIPALSTHTANRLLPCHEVIEKREMAAFLKKAISELTPREQKIIRKYMLGKSTSEIAKDEGIGKTRIQQIQSRAYRKIRWNLEKRMRVIDVDD